MRSANVFARPGTRLDRYESKLYSVLEVILSSFRLNLSQKATRQAFEICDVLVAFENIKTPLCFLKRLIKTPPLDFDGGGVLLVGGVYTRNTAVYYTYVCNKC